MNEFDDATRTWFAPAAKLDRSALYASWAARCMYVAIPWCFSKISPGAPWVRLPRHYWTTFLHHIYGSWAR